MEQSVKEYLKPILDELNQLENIPKNGGGIFEIIESVTIDVHCDSGSFIKPKMLSDIITVLAKHKFTPYGYGQKFGVNCYLFRRDLAECLNELRTEGLKELLT